MQNRINRIILAIIFSALMFVCGAAFNARGVKAASKRAYMCDIVVPYDVQRHLDQRSAEGWRFMAMSEGNQDGNTVTVLVFEKE